MSEERKTDRRTIYTKNAIKDSLLVLMEQKSFDKITVTDLCRSAEINRGTYYLHYYELSEVLDELIDDAIAGTDGLSGMLQITGACSRNRCDNSLCRLIRHSTKYRVIFMDESLTGRIIEKIAERHKDGFVTDLQARCGVSRQQAEAIFYFQVNGCFAISRWGRGYDCDRWGAVRDVIDPFIAGGLERVISEKE